MKSLLFILFITTFSISLSAKEGRKKSKTPTEPNGEYCAKIENQSMNITIQHAPLKVYISQVDTTVSGCHCVTGVLALKEKNVAGISYDAFFKSIKHAVASTVGCSE